MDCTERLWRVDSDNREMKVRWVVRECLFSFMFLEKFKDTKWDAVCLETEQVPNHPLTTWNSYKALAIHGACKLACSVLIWRCAISNMCLLRMSFKGCIYLRSNEEYN